MKYPDINRRRKYKRPLIKQDIEIAYRHSNSAAEAARYLGVSYKTFRKYAKLYGVFKTNQSGKGVPRAKLKGKQGLLDILDGKHPNYSKSALLERCLRAGIFKKECYSCGYNEVRMDGKIPLLFHHKDGDSKNLKKSNIEPWCYNCIFQTRGKVDLELLELDPVVFQNDLLEVGEVEGEALTEEDLVKIQEELQNEILSEKNE